MPVVDNDNLVGRLAKLEDANCRLHRRCTILGALLFSTMVILGIAAASTQSSFDTLRVRQLLVEDINGHVRSMIAVNAKGEVQQNFFDESGANRLQIGVIENAIARVRLFDEKGTARVSSSAFPTDAQSGLAATTYFSPSGNPRLSLGVSDNGKSAFYEVFDEKDKSMVSLSIKEDGPSIRIFDEQKTLRSFTGISKGAFFDQVYHAGSKDAPAKIASSVYIQPDGDLEQSIGDRNGYLRARTLVTDKYTGTILIFNEKKRVENYLSSDVSLLHLYDPSGVNRLTHGFADDRILSIYRDQRGGDRIRLAVGNDGSSQYQNIDLKGDTTVNIGVNADNEILNYTARTPTQQFGEAMNWVGTGITVLDLINRATSSSRPEKPQ